MHKRFTPDQLRHFFCQVEGQGVTERKEEGIHETQQTTVVQVGLLLRWGDMILAWGSSTD